MNKLIAALLLSVTASMISLPASAVPVSVDFTVERDGTAYVGVYQIDDSFLVPDTVFGWANNIDFHIDLWPELPSMSIVSLAGGNIGFANYLRVDSNGNISVFDQTTLAVGLSTRILFEPDGTFSTNFGDSGTYCFGSCATEIPAPPAALILALGFLLIKSNRNE